MPTFCSTCIIAGIFALGALFLGMPVAAQVPHPPSIESLADATYIFRAVLGGLLTVLIWLAKQQNDRLKHLEDFAQEAKEKRIAAFARLAELEKKVQVFEHEQKEMLSLIGMQRELMLTQYQNKEDMEKHWAMVERTLKEHSDLLRGIAIQLEAARMRKDGEERRRS